MVELADGRVFLDHRQPRGEHRWTSTSSDGGQTWALRRPSGTTVTPVCCAIERYTLKSAGDDRDRILWTGPKGPRRFELVVLTSYDEGRTFTNERSFSKEPAAYSDLTILKDKSVGVLWERRNLISFTRLQRSFLEPGSGRNPPR
jgi:sialidase-1